MKLSARAKLSTAVIVISAYMLAAFFWWTISLINYSRVERDLRLELYRSDSLHFAGEISHNMFTGRFTGPDSMQFNYRGKTMFVDTSKLLQQLSSRYPQYSVKFFPGKPFDQIFKVDVKKSVIDSETAKYRRKRDSWIWEGIFMTIFMLIISITMYVFIDRVIRANQQQNNFLLAITHELKTPVASSKLAIQTLQKQLANSGNESTARFLNIADNNMSRLSKMIDSVLTATRIQSINAKIIKQDLVLEELINDTIAELESSLPPTVKFKLSFVPDLIVQGDRELLEITFSNLISNAAKYSEPGKEEIMISSYIHNGRVAVSIADLGIGIAEKDRKKIFRMFYRVGDEKTRSSTGTGLGLFLVAKILRQHSAIISVESNQPKGSRFNIVFKSKASV
jgi:two-component system phosphate regulon sensor histidine kinase PhoR